MVEFPDEHENKEKDFIVARSPLLRVFLDPMAETDLQMWLKMLNSTYGNIRADLEEMTYQNKREETLGKLLRKAEKTYAFDSELNEEMKISAVCILTLIGYEVGNKAKAMAFFGDIFDRFARIKTIAPTQEGAELVGDALAEGVKWKEGIIKSVPKVFREFHTKTELP